MILNFDLDLPPAELHLDDLELHLLVGVKFFLLT